MKKGLSQPWLEKLRHIRENKMYKEIIVITMPAFIEIVMSTLFGMVDMIMVGQLGPAAIASIGLTNQPFMLLMAVFAAVNVGTTTLVAWNIGAKEIRDARSITQQILIVNGTLGILLSIAGFFSARSVVIFMGAKPDTLHLATQYFQIVSAGLVFQAVTMGITAALRGAGETKIPMLYNVGSNILNVFGNYVLIYGKWGFPQWGVAGAAASTTIARLLACLAGLYVLYYSNKSVIKLSLKERYKIEWAPIKRVFTIGFPSAMEQFFMQSGLILFARTVSGLGTAGFAAHQVGLNLNGLTFSPSMAFGVAATTLVGQSLGANNPERAEKYAKVVHHMAMGVACFIGFMFILFSYPLARLYTSDVTVAAMAGMVLKIMALAQPGQSTQMTLAGALRGAGDTKYPLYSTFTGIWVFRVIIAYLFVNLFHWGLAGAWISMVMDQYTRSAIIFFRFRSGKWKYIKAHMANSR